MLVSEAIERAFSMWLEPAGVDRPAFDFLEGAINDSVTSLTTEGKQTYLPQTIIEFDDTSMELALTGEAESSVTVSPIERGFRHTTAASHLDGVRLLLNPEYPKIDVFNAITDVVSGLYSLGLWRRGASATTSISSSAPFALEAAARDVADILLLEGTVYKRLQKGTDYEVLHDFSPIKLQCFHSGTVVINYRYDFTAPTSLSDDLTSTCGVPSSLAPHIPMAAAGYLLQGREIPAINVERVLQEVSPENIPPGSRLNVGQTLVQLFERRYVGAELRRQREQNPTRSAWVR